MSRPTYYLWKNEFSSQEDFEKEKNRYRKLGFRVVAFQDGPENRNIHVGLKAVIRNHYGKEEKQYKTNRKGRI